MYLRQDAEGPALATLTRRRAGVVLPSFKALGRDVHFCCRISNSDASHWKSVKSFWLMAIDSKLRASCR